MKLILKITVFFFFSLMFLYLMGCQAVFTTSLFKDVLAPDVSQLPPEQLAGYYENILITGTTDEKAAALTSIQAEIESGNTDPELNYVAGILVLDNMGLSIDNMITMMADPANAEVLITEDNLNLIMDMGDYLYTADQGGVELTDADKVFCGIGLLLQTVSIDDLPTFDFNSPAPEQVAAVELINEGVLGSDILQGMLATFLGGGGV